MYYIELLIRIAMKAESWIKLGHQLSSELCLSWQQYTSNEVKLVISYSSDLKWAVNKQ